MVLVSDDITNEFAWFMSVQFVTQFGHFSTDIAGMYTLTNFHGRNYPGMMCIPNDLNNFTNVKSSFLLSSFVCKQKCHIKHIYPIGRALAIVCIVIIHENYPLSDSPRYFLSSGSRESLLFDRGWVRPCCQVRRPSGIYRNKRWFVNFASGSDNRRRTMQHWSTCELLERCESLYLFLVKRVKVSIFLLFPYPRRFELIPMNTNYICIRVIYYRRYLFHRFSID